MPVFAGTIGFPMNVNDPTRREFSSSAHLAPAPLNPHSDHRPPPRDAVPGPAGRAWRAAAPGEALATAGGKTLPGRDLSAVEASR